MYGIVHRDFIPHECIDWRSLKGMRHGHRMNPAQEED